MTVRVLAETTLAPGGETALARYLEVVQPLMAEAGAQLVARYECDTTIAGGPAEYVTLVDYPDHAAVAKVFEHPDYQALVNTRDAAFLRYDVSVLRQTQA